MDDGDVGLRNVTYAQFVALGRAPTVTEIAREIRTTVDDVIAGWRRLHAAHALVLERERDEIRMANPFSAVPTTYRVHADGRQWFANCAWDAFGICAALHVDGQIETSCPDCDAALVVRVVDERPDDDRLLFHCFVPASQWWNDIVFT